MDVKIITKKLSLLNSGFMSLYEVMHVMNKDTTKTRQFILNSVFIQSVIYGYFLQIKTKNLSYANKTQKKWQNRYDLI